MISNPNYFIASEKALTNWLGPTSTSLKPGDVNAALQMILHFSTVLSIVSGRGETPKVIETGSGLSTKVFLELLRNHDDSKLVSIDLGGNDSALLNSRGVFAGAAKEGTLNTNPDFRLVKGATCSIKEIEVAWNKLTEMAWDHISEFIDYRLDNRRLEAVVELLGSPLSDKTVNSQISELGLSAPLLGLYKRRDDELELLRHIPAPKKVLASEIEKLNPNIVFLDSGEFSTLAEFDIVDRLAQPGLLVLVQDVLFPKSIKGFAIGGLLLESKKWDVLWLDKSTPQGLLLAERRPE